MAGVNRFYNPSEGRYVSQFVPEQLPVDLMVQALGNKQKLQDERNAQLITAGNWQQAALPGYDTSYVNQRKQELQNFIAESQGKDLTSPDYLRKYNKFVNDFKNDEGLKRVQQAVDTHNEFLKIQKDIKTGKDVNDYEKAFFNDYNKRYGIYTSNKGQGFKGEIGLGDPNIMRGTDINKEAEGYFDQLKASGSESIKELESGISYKNGWKGIGDKTIKDQVSRTLDLFYESRAGQQLGARFDEQQFKDTPLPTDEIIKHLSPEERQQYESQRKQFVAQQLLAVGKGFKFSDTSTNKDAAVNKDREEKFAFPQQPNIQVQGNAMGFEMPNYDEALGVNGQPGMWQKNVDDMGKYLTTSNKYQNFLDQASGTNVFKLDAQGKPQLTQAEKLMIEGIPGAQEFINGQPLSPEKKAIFDKTIKGFIDENQYKLHTAQLYNKSLEEKMRTAVDNVVGNKKYGEGISFKAALELGESIESDTQANKYKQLVTDMINKGYSKDYIDKWISSSEANLKEKGRVNKTIEGSVNQLVDQLKDIRIWKDAQLDMYSTMKNKKELIKESFNTTPEYSPVATMKPSQQFFIAYEKDKNGRPVASGKTEHADYLIENYAQKSPQAFKVYIGDRLVNPGDIDYPDPSTLELVSSNKELINDRDRETGELTGQKAVFNFKGGYRTTIPDPRNPEKAMFSNTPQQYTFVASGMPLKNYTEAKAKEAYSNYILNPDSEAGKQSFVDYTMYKNPDKAKDVAKVNALTEPGQRTTFKRTMYNLDSGKKEDLNIKVKKSESQDGTLILTITDKDGNTILPDKRLNGPTELASVLDNYEQAVNAEGLKQTELGIQPKKVQGPNYDWLKEQVLNPSVPVDNSSILKAAK